MALATIVKKIIGSRNERTIKRLARKVKLINALELDYQALSDEGLKQKTNEFKTRFAQGESLDSLLVEAFATVREVSRRTLGLRHYDVQLIGGMVLHEGNIAEMLTGEGKTLVSTLPTYLNALAGKGVHIITVNDYLAKRDADWMRPIYTFLGLTVGINVPGMDHAEKQAAYRADITYGTNNEFGFDYLRDNMAFSLADKVQRDLFFSIVDEVDSILIDEARTPLIISGQADDSSELYTKINKIIPHLTMQKEEDGAGDYTLDEKNKQAFFTEAGHQHVEELLTKAGILAQGTSLYDATNITIMHYLSASLRAHTLFQVDVDYIVKDNEVIIVDEHTGRLMQGRRWSDGLHQAVEAKEGVQIQTENQTLASITFQNYFRLYDKLSGMTGTADTEAYEFHQIYGLEVVVIPSNRKVQRIDYADKVYMTAEKRYAAVIDEIKECQENQQPVLVGTTSIEVSEYLSNMLNKANIKHSVLNAKQHEQEAHIIAQAGRPGAVTIATNMAGRGTDIVLGGNLDEELAMLEAPSEAEIAEHKAAWKIRHKQVLDAGGLHVLGTERHESRRIDNQLRGRSGRQGDPGSSRFYLSLEDNLLRIFASERLAGLMNRLGVDESEAMESKMLSRVIENAQRKVEGHNFDIRKQLLEYDDVANDQRKVIYAQRNEILGLDDISEIISAIKRDDIKMLVHEHVPNESFHEQWHIRALESQLKSEYNIELPLHEWVEANDEITDEMVLNKVVDAVDVFYQNKCKVIGKEIFGQVEKSILLSTLDSHWKDHLAAMDHLRQGIHLRGYAQKNPKQEYKREAFNLFSTMLDSLKHNVMSALCLIQVQQEDPALLEAERQQQTDIALIHDNQSMLNDAQVSQPEQKIGRNQICPCGSGKKYKHCHGQIN
ncbi:MAG: preprotein translocase subunit SecA [Legionellales bacterium]|nr:preprotein translocase subunit SecA [Legionellales bacterium]